MLTQIEYYDKDTIKNILACLSIRPDRIVFIYDKEIKDMNRFICLENCFRKHLPDIIFETQPVGINDVMDIYAITKQLIEKYGNCVMDITGGSELMTVAGAKAGMETGTKMYYTDIVHGRVENILDREDYIPTATLHLDDYVDARGAHFSGNSHNEPQPERFDAILSMCRYIFHNIKQWRKTCSYIQQAMANTAKEDVELRAVSRFRSRGGNEIAPDERILKKFEELDFIKDLYISPGHVVFSFSSQLEKTYLINYGVWLELFVYIHAVRSGIFTDVRLGTMVDWDIFDDKSVPGNEIDVIFTDNSLPVFVSCKLTDVTTAAINELVLERKRLGGWFSKAIIVSFSDEKSIESGAYKRAVEFGVELLDKRDIMSENFGEKLVNAVSGHDLVSLKWKKF
ncbi:DUF1887 family CARF protein [Lachnospiraceae bacterium NSJ-143]|nr:DUF1887 family CARF protein [Lachnospiraceae bacterium NSJ-143]